MTSLREKLSFVFQIQHLKWRQVASVIVLVIMMMSTYLLSPMDEWFHDNAVAKWEFSLREKLGQSPKLDSRIKILAFGNRTANRLQRQDLLMSEWGALFEAISKQNPKSIFIDKIWRLPIGQDYPKPLSKDEAAEFTAKMKKLKTQVVVGSFFKKSLMTEKKWEGAPKPLDLTKREHQFSTYSKSTSTIEDMRLDWLTLNSGYVYGPSKLLVDAFLIGHIDYERHGYIRPVLVPSPGKVVIHGSLLAGAPNSIEIIKEHFYINNQSVSLDRKGRIYTNLSSQDEYRRKTDQLAKALVEINEMRKNKNQKITVFGDPISEGDYVVILPLMYTGNVDYIDTPVGKIQGGYLTASLINSAITGNWIKTQSTSSSIAIIVLFAIIGAFFAARLPTAQFWIISASLVFLIIANGFYQFSFNNFVVSWFSSAATLVFSGVSVHTWRNARAAGKARKLRDALSGTIPSDKIDELIESATDFRLEPCEKVVSIMFMDIVGFSMTAEVQTPAEVFGYLKKQLNLFTQIVHDHGGIIDRNLGDGILCFFGYDYVSQRTDLNHADTALKCAIAIQEAALQQTLGAMGRNEPMYPVRIGINTANVFIGEIGDSRRIDFTLIGHGVNFASRLEGSCEPYMIMMGPGTKQALKEFRQDADGLHRREVQIKHHENLFEAYEYDPFWKDHKQVNEAVQAYRKQFNIQRKYARIPVADRGSLFIDFEEGRGDIVNVSLFGFAVELDRYLAKGVSLAISIKATDSFINKKIKDLNLFPLNVEVCWGGVDRRNGRYVHGLKIKALNETQCELLMASYNDLLSNRSMLSVG